MVDVGVVDNALVDSTVVVDISLTNKRKLTRHIMVRVATLSDVLYIRVELVLSRKHRWTSFHAPPRQSRAVYRAANDGIGFAARN